MFSKRALLNSVVTASLLVVAPDLTAQLPATETFELTSTVLDETRSIDVVFPVGYEREPSRRYPVMVVIDGNFLAFPAGGTADFLGQIRDMPQVIVAGIRSTDRYRDLTPTPTGETLARVTAGGRAAGGADRYLRFITEEVLPELDGRYRTYPYRILVGHSLGGLFATYTLGTRSQHFSAYLAIDAALGWNNREIVDRAITALGESNGAVRYATVQVGLGMSPDEWLRLREAAPDQPGELITLETENHQSAPLRALREGLRSLFTDYDAGPRPEGTGAVKHLVDHAHVMSLRLGYPVYLDAALLLAALRTSLDQRLEQDARLGAAELASRHPGHSALAEVRRAITAVFGPGDPGVPRDEPGSARRSS